MAAHFRLRHRFVTIGLAVRSSMHPRGAGNGRDATYQIMTRARPIGALPQLSNRWRS